MTKTDDKPRLGRPPAPLDALSSTDRRRLKREIRRADISEIRRRRLQALQLLDEGLAPCKIIETVGCSHGTIANVRTRYNETGLDAVLAELAGRRPGSGRKWEISEDQEDQIIDFVCEGLPEGCDRWTVQLVMEEAIQREIIVRSFSLVKIGRLLRSRGQRLWWTKI